jgi:hypothetical protein
MKVPSLGPGQIRAAMASHVGDGDDYDLVVWNRTPKELAGARVARPGPEAIDGAEGVVLGATDGHGDIRTGRRTATGYGKTREMGP